jgi:hypothetical protein
VLRRSGVQLPWAGWAVRAALTLPLVVSVTMALVQHLWGNR